MKLGVKRGVPLEFGNSESKRPRNIQNQQELSQAELIRLVYFLIENPKLDEKQYQNIFQSFFTAYYHPEINLDFKAKIHEEKSIFYHLMRMAIPRMLSKEKTENHFCWPIVNQCEQSHELHSLFSVVCNNNWAKEFLNIFCMQIPFKMEDYPEVFEILALLLKANLQEIVCIFLCVNPEIAFFIFDNGCDYDADEIEYSDKIFHMASCVSISLKALYHPLYSSKKPIPPELQREVIEQAMVNYSKQYEVVHVNNFPVEEAYQFRLMSALPENRKPAKGIIYCEKERKSLHYIVLSPEGKKVEYSLNLKVSEAKKTLDELQSKILKEALKKEHISRVAKKGKIYLKKYAEEKGFYYTALDTSGKLFEPLFIFQSEDMTEEYLKTQMLLTMLTEEYASNYSVIKENLDSFESREQAEILKIGLERRHQAKLKRKSERLMEKLRIEMKGITIEEIPDDDSIVPYTPNAPITTSYVGYRTDSISELEPESKSESEPELDLELELELIKLDLEVEAELELEKAKLAAFRLKRQ